MQRSQTLAIITTAARSPLGLGPISEDNLLELTQLSADEWHEIETIALELIQGIDRTLNEVNHRRQICEIGQSTVI